MRLLRNVLCSVPALALLASSALSAQTTPNYKGIYVATAQVTHTNLFNARVWKDGWQADLTEVTEPSWTNDIQITGKDQSSTALWVSGSRLVGGKQDATLWKKGVPVTLSQPGFSANTAGLLLSGSSYQGYTAYVTGYQNDGTKDIATYWTVSPSNTVSRVTLGTNESVAYQIARAASGNLYTVGYEKNATGVTVATVWKNQNRFAVLSDGTKDSSATGIVVTDSALFVVTYGLADGLNTCQVFKLDASGNKTLYATLPTTQGGMTWKMVAQGTTLYVAGHNKANGLPMACVWKVTGPNAATRRDLGAAGVMSTARGIVMDGTAPAVCGVQMEGTKFRGMLWTAGTTVTVKKVTEASTTGLTIAVAKGGSTSSGCDDDDDHDDDDDDDDCGDDD